MTAVVSVGGRLRAYVVGDDGLARRVEGEFAVLPADVVAGRFEAHGDVLYLVADDRMFVVVVETCDECMSPIEDGGIKSADGRYTFCDAFCREEWRFKLA